MQTIIKSEIFTQYPEIIHGVSTKYSTPPVVGVVTNNTGFSNNMSKFVGDDIEHVMKNRFEFYTQLGIDMNTAKFAHANQIHSANVAVVNDIPGSNTGLFKETDALITNQSGVFLIISVADCLPVMIYDTVKQVIANVHSGWRGTAKGIAANTLEKMKTEFGCNADEMIAFLGPGISKENFEVGAEVAEMFDEKYVHHKEVPLIKGDLGGLESETLRSAQGLYIDLKSVVTDQLLSAGVKSEYIDTCPYCTFAEKDMLHSYRRDKDGSGRMFAVIGIR